MALARPSIEPNDTLDALEIALAAPRPAPKTAPPADALSPAALTALAAFTNPDGLPLGRAAAAAWRATATRALAIDSDTAEITRLLEAWRVFTREITPDRLRAEHADEERRDAMIAAYRRSASVPGMPPPRSAAALEAGRQVAAYLEDWTRVYAKLLRVDRGRHGVPGMSADELCGWLGTALLAALATPAHFEACARPGYPVSLLIMFEARNRLRAVKRVRLVRPEDLTVYPDDGRGSPDAARRARDEERELRDLLTRALFLMSTEVRKWYVAAREWVDGEGAWEGRLNGAEIARSLGLDKSTASRMLPKVREALRKAGAEDFVRVDHADGEE